jgi:putative transposase
MLGDKAFDSAELRGELDERGTRPVTPNRSNRKQPFRFSKRLYKLRWRIEAASNRLKDFRRIATRYARLARDYLASVCLIAAQPNFEWRLESESCSINPVGENAPNIVTRRGWRLAGLAASQDP